MDFGRPVIFLGIFPSALVTLSSAPFFFLGLARSCSMVWYWPSFSSPPSFSLRVATASLAFDFTVFCSSSVSSLSKTFSRMTSNGNRMTSMCSIPYDSRTLTA